MAFKFQHRQLKEREEEKLLRHKLIKEKVNADMPKGTKVCFIDDEDGEIFEVKNIAYINSYGAICLFVIQSNGWERFLFYSALKKIK